MQSKFIYLFVLLFFIVFISCDENNKTPDISNIEVSTKIRRFDQYLMSIDTSKLDLGIKSTDSIFNVFSQLYFTSILPVTQGKHTLNNNVKNYISDSSTLSIFKVVQDEYTDVSLLEDEFNKAFRYYKYYFPTSTVPNLYSFISTFNYQSFIFIDGKKDGIGIGLDMFINNKIDYKSYFPKAPQFSDYSTKSFNKKNIVRKSLQVLLEDKIQQIPTKSMLDHMIERGKIIYILDKVFPEYPDSFLMDYKTEDMVWCDNNEYELWTFFKGEQLIYESKPRIIAKYINPSPYSPGMDEHAPGRTAVYTGWKIVDSYMINHNSLQLEKLISLSSVDILKGSRYKPKRKN